MRNETKDNIQIVELWHEALNIKHKKGLSDLVKENVKMVGPKGNVEGVNIMLEWIDRANIMLTPKRYFQLNDIVIVEELAVWYEAETEKEMDTALLASVFVLENGLITSIQRYNSINEAFDVTGLNELTLVERK